jgi:Na+:H+ antiporter, NhaC family
MTADEKADASPRTLLIALVPIAILVALLWVNIRVFGSDSNHIPLVLAASVAALLAVLVLKKPWKDLEDGIVKAIGMAMPAVLILLVVGMLIAAWVRSGVVPLLIVYGLKLLSPAVFAPTACVVCCVVSLATGSSWTTAGTVGVALMGAGSTLGLDPGIVAGAVVSGAYFGDKMSPLSDTTNLAPAMAGATLIEHVRHMVYTVTPSLIIALVLYAVFGTSGAAQEGSLDRVAATIRILEDQFVMSPWLLLPPVIVLGLVATRFPALPALVIGTFAAVALGLVIQNGGPLPDALKQYSAELFGGVSMSVSDKLPAGSSDAVVNAAKGVDGLLDGRGGMKSMLSTVALIFCALAFGGILERSGMLGAVTNTMLRFVRGTGSLIAATILTCLGVNILASDQYMAIVIPGRMFRRAYIDRGLHPKNLSRALEDSGTVTSALVPWNTCGAQMFAVLGVSAWAYGPWAFLNWLCPIVSIVYGFTGFTITRITPEEARRYAEL